MVVDLKVLDRIVDDDDPEHIKISFGESFFSSWQSFFFAKDMATVVLAILILADTQDKQKRHTGCQQLSRRHMLTSSEAFILYLPVKKKPLT